MVGHSRRTQLSRYRSPGSAIMNNPYMYTAIDLANRYAQRNLRPMISNVYRRVTSGNPPSSIRSVEQSTARSTRSSARRNLNRAFASAVGTQVPSSGGGESRSYTRYGRLRKVPMPKTVSKNVVHRVDGVTGSCLQNTQGVLTLGRFMEHSDILRLYTAVNYVASDFTAAKLNVISVRSDSMITNACNLNTHCVIYDVLARRDGFTVVNVTPESVFSLGFADASTGAAADFSIPGASPWNNPRFTEAYKIIKQTKLILAPGQIHNHTVKYDVNRVISKELYGLNGTGPVGGLTLYSFVVFHGTPVHDASTELIIGTGPVKLDVVVTEDTSFKIVDRSFPTNDYVSNLAAVTAPEQWMTDGPADTTAAT